MTTVVRLSFQAHHTCCWLRPVRRMMTMKELIAFLRARYDVRSGAAHEALSVQGVDEWFRLRQMQKQKIPLPYRMHIVFNNPEHVMHETQAKNWIIRDCEAILTTCPDTGAPEYRLALATLKHLAWPYQDMIDFRPEWRA